MSDWASESGHWYKRDGATCYEVYGANGQRRNTTLRDARKLNLLPSVSGVIDLAAKPGLETWKAQQLMLAALTLPRAPAEAENAWLKRVKEDSKSQSKNAAERGVSLHAALESYFRAEPVPEQYAVHVAGAMESLAVYCGTQTWAPEKSFASGLGYGGKVDLHSQHWVIDFKTKEFDATNSPDLYDEHCMQLAAYMQGLLRPAARAGILWVSSSVPGLSAFTGVVSTDLIRGRNMFNALLDYWWAKNESEDYKRFLK